MVTFASDSLLPARLWDVSLASSGSVEGWGQEQQLLRFCRIQGSHLVEFLVGCRQYIEYHKKEGTYVPRQGQLFREIPFIVLFNHFPGVLPCIVKILAFVYQEFLVSHHKWKDRSHWLLLLRMGFRETDVELRSPLNKLPSSRQKRMSPQGKACRPVMGSL